MNLRASSVNNGSSANNEERGNPPRDSPSGSVDDANNASVVASTTRANDEETKNDLGEKLMDTPESKRNRAERERTIPVRDELAVRYVRMRNKGTTNDEEAEKSLEESLPGARAERPPVKFGEDRVGSSTDIAERIEDGEKMVKSHGDREDGEDDDDESGEASVSSSQPSLESVDGKTTIRKLSGDSVASRLRRTRNLVKKDCGTLAREIRARRKEKGAAFRISLERRVESVEKMLEDRVEKIFEETAEKHPWLQPIETWLVDRYKSAKSSNAGNFTETNRSNAPNSSSDSEIEKTCPLWKKDEETESGEIFIETVKKSSDEETKRKKNQSFLHSPKDSTEPFPFRHPASSKNSTESAPESSPELSESRITVNISNDGKEDTTTVAKICKVEKSHANDFLEKIRDGFKERVEDVQRYFQRTSRLADVNRKLKSQIWSSVVTIVLVEAKNLLPMDIDGLSDPYVKFRLGTEKYKSKVINKTLSPVWLEQFDLHLYEDPYLGQELEVTVWDRDKSHQDDLMGRTTIDLASMERETTHRLWRDLEDGAGHIFLLLTISGTTASETISDLAAHEETPQERARLLQKYALHNSLQRPRDVGHLTVKVYRAQGLAAADLGGKSDPFCVLELVNARLQTQTEYKTLAPNWQKIFTFNVKDINSVLEVTVYDEDRDHKVEFLGRVAIPLLRMRNAEKRWYALKDKKLRGRAKGNSPQILLEMIVVWNVLRACARTLNPKEKKYMEPEVKFKRQVFLRNVLRLKAVIMFFIDMGKYIQSCWEWESKTRSIVALVLFVLGCYYFEPWMIPAAAVLILMKYCMVTILTGGSFSNSYHHIPSGNHLQDSGDGASDEGPVTPGDDDDDEDDKDKEEKKSLKERLQAIQEVTQTVQNSIGSLASLCERIKNLFNFTVPYLSYLAIVLTMLGAVVLYLIPMRYLILAWGVNKFLRKLLRPHSVPNNEVLDLISRVPDDEDLLNYRELKPVPTADCERGGNPSASTSSTGTTRRDQRKKNKAA